MILSTNTYAAYNTWGGKCLYASDDRSVACRLSFQRPWQRGLLRRVPSTIRNINTGTPGFGERPLFDAFPRHVQQGYHHWTRFAGFHTWESIFVPWLEANGYEVDYCVQGDLDRDPGVVDGYRMLTSVGHDEYWTLAGARRGGRLRRGRRARGVLHRQRRVLAGAARRTAARRWSATSTCRSSTPSTAPRGRST